MKANMGGRQGRRVQGCSKFCKRFLAEISKPTRWGVEMCGDFLLVTMAGRVEGRF